MPSNAVYNKKLEIHFIIINPKTKNSINFFQENEFKIIKFLYELMRGQK